MHDNEPAMVQLAERIRDFRAPRKTQLEPIVRAEHEGVAVVERFHQTLQAHVRAMRLDFRARTGENIAPGHALWTALAACSVGSHAVPAQRTARGDRL